MIATMTTNPANPTETGSSPACFLARAEGRISYEVAGDGPLVVLVPGMGELRSTYRSLAPALLAAGYRVASTDLRGHGDSDTTFASYGDVDTAGDVAALIGELGGPAVIVGNSMGAGAAVLVAADHPELVTGLVLVGPWVRNGAAGALQRALFRVVMARVWAAAAWKAYLPKLYAGRRPDDFEEYRDRLVANLHRPGYARAFSLTTRTDHAPAEARLGVVVAPVMVIMGELDPDWKSPEAEARWIGEALHGEVVMVPEAGHYPQSQQPEVTAEAVQRFLHRVTRGA
jgi:pimeloyl-ACP methyl ester carboxylesterase